MLDAGFVPSTTYYLALFTTDPSTTGASGEVTGGSYARQAIDFGSASSGSQASTNAQNFTGMPAESGGVPYFGLFTTRIRWNLPRRWNNHRTFRRYLSRFYDFLRHWRCNNQSFVGHGRTNKSSRLQPLELSRHLRRLKRKLRPTPNPKAI